MLFNSFEFLVLFLPVSLGLFFGLGARSPRLAAAWLFGASLLFYGWWNPLYVGLLLGSILVNFSFGWVLSRPSERFGPGGRRAVLVLGLGADLGLLGYYKYANFFVDSLNGVFDLGWGLEPVLLPLGISFFTFTQIAFLVDAYRGEVREPRFIHYGLFVTYFPHLIAGPVLHHKEMMPQFAQPETYRIQWGNLSLGLTYFAFGLFKKLVLADGIAPLATQVFSAAAGGATPSLFIAWGGALAFGLQLYLDFSGYCDMAMGLSLLFGVRLPLNFNSPYQAVNIIDFWRRWHMTLSRFLRDYLYFPLGGNRRGVRRRYLNLLATMLLGGLWHGAGWTFLLWGALHGAYLMVNHAWLELRRVLGWGPGRSWLGRWAGRALTFLAVMVAWVPFRAADLDTSWRLLGGMAGANGIQIPEGVFLRLPAWASRILTDWGIQAGSWAGFDRTSWLWIGGLCLLVWLAPNSQQLLARFRPALEPVTPSPWLGWRPNLWWMGAVAGLLFFALTRMDRHSEFLYYQF